MVSFVRLSAFVALGGLTLSALPPKEPILGPGVSRELATRRAELISGVRYDLRLSVVSRDTARGSVSVRFLTKRSADVVLDFRGPSLTKVTVNGSPTHGTFNGAHLHLPANE